MSGVVSRALDSAREIATRYGVPDGPILRLARARVMAKPVGVFGEDGALLWALSPQLGRTPVSHTLLKMAAFDPSRARRLPGLTLFAAVDGFSYFHWLLGVVPKLLLARKSRELCEYDHVIVNARHGRSHDFQTETLTLLGIEHARTEWVDHGFDVLCDEMDAPEEPTKHDQTHLEPWALNLLREAFGEWTSARASEAGPRKIFISRAAAKRKRLSDESSVAARFIDAGYTSVQLEDLPLTTQARWLREAHAVAGVHGAGLANIVFCAPRTEITEIAHPSWVNPCFERLAHTSQLNYNRVSAADLSAAVAEA